MNKLEIYAIGLVLLLLAFLAAEFHGRHVGRQETEGKYAAAALKQSQDAAKKEQADRDNILNLSTAYEQKIAQLRVDAAIHPQRACWVRSGSTAPSLPTATAIAGGAVQEGSGRSGGAAGSDTNAAPDLYSFAYDCKAIATQLNAVIDAWPR